MKVCIVLLKNRVNVSIKQPIFGVIVGIHNDTESQLFLVIRIYLIVAIESLMLTLHSFGKFAAQLVCVFAGRILSFQFSFCISMMIEVK